MHEMPWPVSHGGFIDLYWKLVELNQAGIFIHLHCFTKKEIIPYEIKQLCFEVNIYQRRTGISNASFLYPYIVSSRRDKQLLGILLQDNYPILFEGIHTTWWLYKNKFPERKTVVRLHNVEYRYYAQLALPEKNIIKKIYYAAESRLLKKFEGALSGKSVFAAVSSSDAALYKNTFGAVSHFLPVFIPWEVSSLPGKGTYCLYHGNLAVNENVKAAEWLIEKVFNALEMPLIIAGRNPPAQLQKLIENAQHTSLVANPSDTEMQDLIRNAQINIIISFNETGVKLKLLNALFNGRHCIADHAALQGAATADCSELADSITAFRERINSLLTQPFTEEKIARRRDILEAVYNNKLNAEKLIALLY